MTAMRQMLTRMVTTLLALIALCGCAAGQEVTLRVGGAPLPPPAGLLWSFWIIGGLTIAGAVATITRRNPISAAVCLVATLFCSAGVYLLLHATFMAVIQVLVYAGAIMVLFVLVIMSVERPEQEEVGFLRGTVAKIVGVVAMLWLLYRAVTVLVGPEVRRAGPVADTFGDVSAIGRQLFTDYLFAFEAISILLLVAIVGAVAVSRKRATVEEAPAGDGAKPGGPAAGRSQDGGRSRDQDRGLR